MSIKLTQKLTDVTFFTLFRLIAEAYFKSVDFTGQITEKNQNLKLRYSCKDVCVNEIKCTEYPNLSEPCGWLWGRGTHSKINSSVNTGFCPSLAWVFATCTLFK